MFEDDWGKEEPWFEVDNFIDILLDKINILDILDKYEIHYFKSPSGNFSHKLRCPFPDHLDGQERTASLYVSEKNGDFRCFGCNNSGNTINFLMFYLGVPYYKAVEILSNYAGITKNNINDIEPVIRKKVDPNHTVLTHVFNSGVSIRKFLCSVENTDNYKKWSNWASKQFNKLDYYLDNLDDEQWEVVKNYYDKLNEFLTNNDK